MRNLHLFIAALAVVQCVRYGRSALLFVAPSIRPGPEGPRDRRAHLMGFLVVLLSLALLVTSVHALVRGPPQG